jgi:TusA-related sulfurtransferase
MKYDLCDLVCPLSKIKALEAIDSLRAGETAEVVLGDTDSLKSVVRELKTRSIKLEFTHENETRFVLTITR